MIGRIRGTVLEKTVGTVTVDVGGVGWELQVPLRTLEAMPPVGSPTDLHVHTHVREDAIVLFGFIGAAERRVFQRLISVQGIGPKLALAALGIYSAQELQSAIVRGDVKALSRISGVGPKSAQRIVLELSGTIGSIDTGTPLAPSTPAELGAAAIDDLRLGLLELGYAAKQADSICEKLRPRAAEGASVEALLRDALVLLRS